MKRFGGALCLAVTTVIACTSDRTAQQDLRLYVFDCGRIQLDTLDMFAIATMPPSPTR